MDNLDTSFMVDDDDLLNFTLDDEHVQEESTTAVSYSSCSSLESSNPLTTTSFCHDSQPGLLPEFAEEELEWLLNKDAFPAVETCFGILAENPELVIIHQSPVSVLDTNSNSSSSNSSSSNSNSSSNNNGMALASCFDSLKVPTNYPVRARSNRSRKRRASFVSLPIQESLRLKPSARMANSGASMGRRCLHCHADKTPQWRAGPMGPKTLCNACGVRYKSGRLLPEYRPMNSPTFSSTLHSNSHRKVIEMRRQKQLPA